MNYCGFLYFRRGLGDSTPLKSQETTRFHKKVLPIFTVCHDKSQVLNNWNIDSNPQDITIFSQESTRKRKNRDVCFILILYGGTTGFIYISHTPTCISFYQIFNTPTCNAFNWTFERGCNWRFAYRCATYPICTILTVCIFVLFSEACATRVICSLRNQTEDRFFIWNQEINNGGNPLLLFSWKQRRGFSAGHRVRRCCL